MEDLNDSMNDGVEGMSVWRTVDGDDEKDDDMPPSTRASFLRGSLRSSPRLSPPNSPRTSPHGSPKSAHRKGSLQSNKVHITHMHRSTSDCGSDVPHTELNSPVIKKISLRICLQSVLELKTAGIIFRLISAQPGESDELSTSMDSIRIILVNLAARNVRENSPLRRLLHKFFWSRRSEHRFDLEGFRGALGFMYLSLCKVVALDNSPRMLSLSYIPTVLVKHLQLQSVMGPEIRVSKMMFFGTCMLADISGFTVMSA
jgi:hypothetical protein